MLIILTVLSYCHTAHHTFALLNCHWPLPTPTKLSLHPYTALLNCHWPLPPLLNCHCPLPTPTKLPLPANQLRNWIKKVRNFFWFGFKGGTLGEKIWKNFFLANQLRISWFGEKLNKKNLRIFTPLSQPWSIFTHLCHNHGVFLLTQSHIQGVFLPAPVKPRE